MENAEKKTAGGREKIPLVRDVVAGDGPAVKPLLDRLGYAFDAPEIGRRIARKTLGNEKRISVRGSVTLSYYGRLRKTLNIAT